MNGELKKLLSILSPNEVSEICKPLFDNFNINSFIFTTVYNDKSYWSLSNRADWVEHFYNNKYAHPTVDWSSLKSGHYCHLQNLGIPDNQIITAREYFDADNWFNIIKSYDRYYEVLGFATSKGNAKIFDFYLNHTDVLDHFYYYFKEKAHKLIKNAEKNKIKLPDSDLLLDEPINSDPFENKKNDFLKQTQCERYYIVSSDDNSYITKREYQILSLLSKGKSVKDISSALNLTSRTVKSYLYNAMNRLNCYSRAQIIQLFQVSEND